MEKDQTVPEKNLNLSLNIPTLAITATQWATRICQLVQSKDDWEIAPWRTVMEIMVPHWKLTNVKIPIGVMRCLLTHWKMLIGNWNFTATRYYHGGSLKTEEFHFNPHHNVVILVLADIFTKSDITSHLSLEFGKNLCHWNDDWIYYILVSLKLKISKCI